MFSAAFERSLVRCLKPVPVHKILHVIPSVGPQRGGPSVMVRTIARALAQSGMEIHVATTDDNGPDRSCVILGTPQMEDGATFWYFPRQTRFYIFSWPLTRWLAQHVREFDLVHIHALFSYAALPAALLAHRAGVPYIVRPLGTLNRWGIKNRRPWLKKLSFRLIESRILKSAAAIHFTSGQECTEAAALVTDGRAEIIPNPLDASPHSWPLGAFRARFPHLEGRRIILFLSRIDEKKGLDLLLAAFAHVQQQCPDTVLVLAGSGDPDFVATLRVRAAALGISSSVLWAGFLIGEQKWAALADADIFALPSYSENFGNAIVEAMAAGLPVVISDQVGIHTEIAEARAGAVVPCSVDRLAQQLLDLLADGGLRSSMGQNGRRLCRRYSPDAVGARMLDLYNEIST